MNEMLTRRKRWGNAVVAWLATLWLGLLLGVSFLATPVKFHAQSLELPVALEVGRVTFALFAQVEWALGGALLVAALVFRLRLGTWAGLGVLALILLAEALWLLPVLDERAGHIMAGATLQETNHHLLYIAAESLKALVLLALSVGALWKLARVDPD